MINKKFFLILFLFFVFVESSFALETYIGIQINNLTDDPAHSCVGEPGYPASGRIQAISSILPTYPLYFNLSYYSNGSTIWSGNSIFDQDYEIGDTIYLPQAFNLSSGESYKIMIDIDAIRVYLSMVDGWGFTTSSDNNYWTAGHMGTTSVNSQRPVASNSCISSGNSNTNWKNTLFFISKNRATLLDSCMSSGVASDCEVKGFIGIDKTDTIYDFKIDTSYNNLHLSTVGNFVFNFIY